jgi:glycosyltransferase involved in cell wall biosynthesis
MIIINQSTGSLFNSLVSALASETDIYFICGNYGEKLPRVINRKMKAYNRETLFGRAASWLVFSLQVIFCLLLAKPQPVFVVTNPPFSLFAVWLVSLAKKFSYSILVYDLYPDIIHETDILHPNHFVIRIWESINKRIFEKAEVIFSISEGMKDKIRTYAKKTRIVVIPNWGSDSLLPIAKSKNPLVEKYHLEEKIVIMYSGNIGITHNLSFILRLASEFSDNDHLRFIIMGGGVGYKKVKEEIDNLSLKNVLFFGYISEIEFPLYLALADFGIVTLAKGLENSSVPSKTYSYLKVGAAIISIADRPNELDRIISSELCGISVEQHEVEELIRKLDYLLSNKGELKKLKNNSLIASTEKYTKSKSISIYLENLRKHRILR